jgi:hypothetical protein
MILFCNRQSSEAKSRLLSIRQAFLLSLANHSFDRYNFRNSNADAPQHRQRSSSTTFYPSSFNLHSCDTRVSRKSAPLRDIFFRMTDRTLIVTHSYVQSHVYGKARNHRLPSRKDQDMDLKSGYPFCAVKNGLRCGFHQALNGKGNGMGSQKETNCITSIMRL